MAQFLAKSLFCTDKVGVLPCEKCRNCKLIEQGEFPDVTLIKPVNQVIKTERIRDWWGSFLKQGLKASSRFLLSSKLRRCILMQPILCSRSSKNPRVRFTFFFLTSDEEKILPTIRSRTQIFHFKKQEEKLILLLEQMGLVKKKATF